MSVQRTVLVHWRRLGPYHHARLRAAAALLAQHGIRLAALELQQGSDDYLWENAPPAEDYARYTLLPDRADGRASWAVLGRRLGRLLAQIQPIASAICGYSTPEALGLLAWCRRHQRSAILMSDSKADDFRRRPWREALKRCLVGQFEAALCAGTPQRAYLLQLGMPAERIFLGYDAVDNAFFIQGSDAVRQAPQRWRRLPGLGDPRPFFLASGRFLARKNYLGLLRAYARYHQRCAQERRDPWRLVLLGDGDERPRLEAEIDRLGLQAQATLAGVHPMAELPAYYGLAGAFIHPALQDQWGLVVNEAMASGLPVLVSRRAGCAQDLVRDGVEGFTFDPQDEGALVGWMDRLSSGQVDLRRMGQAARRTIQEWGVERFAEGLWQAIQVGVK